MGKATIALSRADIQRLSVLLSCYESPYTLPSEAAVRAADCRAHNRLHQRLLRALAR
jgi:hypothetical protein